MKFFWLVSFCGLSTGVLCSPVFPFTLLSLMLLLFFKKKYLMLFVAFFCVGSFLASLHGFDGTYELIGYVQTKRPNHVIATSVKIFQNNVWKNCLHKIKIYTEDLEVGETFYAFGRVQFQFSYPPLTMDPTFAAGSVHATRGFNKIHSKLSQFKEKVLDLFAKNVEDHFELFATLVFSDPSFDPSQSERVRKSGLAHLFAVSGLHVGIVYTLFDVLISAFTHSFFIRRPLSVLFTLLFSIMTGPSPSALRAALLLAIWNVFKVVDYPIEPLNLLGLIAALNLLFEPFILLSPSFLMSYSAVATLIAIQDRIKDLNIFAKNLLISLSAFIGVAPFLFLFSTLNLLAPLMSVPAVLLAAPLLWASVLAMFLLAMGLQNAAAMMIRGATPFAWTLQRLIELSSRFLNISKNFPLYILSSVALLFLLWHFGHRPKNLTS